MDSVGVSVKGAALKGQGWPQLVVDVREPVTGLEVSLHRSDGKTVHLSARRIGKGAVQVFDLHQPDGAFHYEGSLVARFPQGPPQKLPVSFDAAVMPPPRLTLGDEPVNLAEHTVTLTADRVVDHVWYRVHADDGTVIDEETESFPDSKAGEPIVIHWHQTEPGVILQIELRVTDPYSFFQNVNLFPWKIEIPHEDVLFETAKWDILPSEQSKLDAALDKLLADIEKYGRFAKVELFVAGYTDTVGDARSNQVLSENRATSIGRYFRAHGVKIPISCTGFGRGRAARPHAGRNSRGTEPSCGVYRRRGAAARSTLDSAPVNPSHPIGDDMGAFSEKEVAYLQSQKLGRMATVGAGGKPHVVPVGFRFDAQQGAFEIGGHGLGKSKKFRDLKQNPNIAFVVDDLVTVNPWAPRGLEVRGRAELFEEGGEKFGPGWDKAWIRIVPERIVSWGIDKPPFTGANARSVS